MDLVEQLGPTFLGSRLKRLGERMQAGAANVSAQVGLPVQPAHMSLLAALGGAALSIGQLAEKVGISQPGITRAVGQLIDLGLARSQTGGDRRQRKITLTPEGENMLARAKAEVWPRIEAAVERLFDGGSQPFMGLLSQLEASLAATPIDAPIAARKAQLLLHDYRDDLAAAFHDINAQWISGMFEIEQTDRDVLENPREKIIEAGGAILFVEARGLGIIGTCALQKSGNHGFELIKMGVLETARGLKAGEFLLAAIIERAMALKADPLYLLTNARCEAAIHLYEKLGFEHDAEIMARYAERYQRCDVAMRYRAPEPEAPRSIVR